MKKTKQREGISLIVLIITIAVVIILAAAVILSMNNNRPIESAKTATEKNDIATLKESASVLSAQWEVDKLLDDTIGTRTEYVQSGLSKQGFEQSMISKVTVNEETGKITVSGDTDGIDFESIKENIIANSSKYLEQASTAGQDITSNKDIGIGTDGKIVNLDLWEYELYNNSYIILGNSNGCSYQPGTYKGEYVDGKIEGTIPRNVYIDGVFYDVKESYLSFTINIGSDVSDNDLLTIAPEIPDTLTIMQGMFWNCSSLTSIVIPASVTSFGVNPYNTFSGCTSLTNITVEAGSTLTRQDFLDAGLPSSCTVVGAAGSID